MDGQGGTDQEVIQDSGRPGEPCAAIHNGKPLHALSCDISDYRLSHPVLAAMPSMSICSHLCVKGFVLFSWP